ncbi:uncharacterized protein [Dysidea avara]|uniref:uncharacterized protein n=1 Tax=Dysidea avara TaxID=196820 RepID=UPI003321112E
MDQDRKGIVRLGKPVVEGAIVIDQIKNKYDTPTMWDLNRYVTRKHATMWRDVGLELKLEHSVLKGIEKDNPQDTTNCFKEVLDKWLRLTPSATWKELEIALTNVNRMQLVLDPVDDIYDTEDEPTAAKKLADTDDSEMLYTVEQSIVQSLLFFYSEFLMN